MARSWYTLYRSVALSFLLAVCACSSSGGGDELPGSGEHVVTYKVEGGSGIITSASISYTDENGEEQHLQHVSLRDANWSYSFRADDFAPLSVSAMLEGEGTSTTLYVTIEVDDACWVENRTFVAGALLTVSSTAHEILTTCPNHGGTTVQ
ncbi:MAG TPA: hypothetical protein PLS81_04780 [Deltaproteobacteria bacterium]|nr:hypothetical protein [Deltaproteobacteria bacterium]HOM28752.1 hypothetical protein [Deltaproteobacteria bacterium]HPP81463.1 hypothetical protein [Deltaproteobacteria bacterium]